MGATSGEGKTRKVGPAEYARLVTIGLPTREETRRGPRGDAWRLWAKGQIRRMIQAGGCTARYAGAQLGCDRKTAAVLLKEIREENVRMYEFNQPEFIAELREAWNATRRRLADAVANTDDDSPRLPALLAQLRDIDRCEHDFLKSSGLLMPESGGDEVDWEHFKDMDPAVVRDLLAEEYARLAMNASPAAARKALLAAESARHRATRKKPNKRLKE